MKNLFLSASSGYNWDHIKTWNLSAKRTGHDVTNILINPQQELIHACADNGVGAVAYSIPPSNKPPHNIRFLLQYKYLMSVVDKYDQVILTDSRDVYFHTDPFVFMNKLLNRVCFTPNSKTVICGSESITFNNEQWNNRNLMEGFGYVFEEYKENEVCNVGVLCGKIRDVAELCLAIFTMCYHNPASVSDQSSFNILMGTKLFSERIHMSRLSEGFMVHLAVTGVNKFKDKLIQSPTWKDDELPNLDGVIYPIIHQYDRVPGIDKKFNL